LNPHNFNDFTAKINQKIGMQQQKARRLGRFNLNDALFEIIDGRLITLLNAQPYL
jgi:hypothetical protein